MTEQPEALRLATVLENKLGGASDEDIEQAAAELRRLYEANQELLEALRDLLADTQHADHFCGDPTCPVAKARAAIRARGQA